MEIPNLLQAVIVELQTANDNIGGIEAGVSIISDDLTKIVKSIIPQLFSSAANFDINLYDPKITGKNIASESQDNAKYSRLALSNEKNTQVIVKSNIINTQDIIKSNRDIFKSDVINLKSASVEVLPKQNPFGDIFKVLDIKQNLLIPYLNGIKLSINRIGYTVENLFESFVNSDMQGDEDRRELLDAIRSLKRKDGVPSKEDKKPSGLFGLLAISAAFLTGTIVGFFEKILQILKLDRTLIKIGTIFANIEKFILESKLYAKVEKMFIKIGAIFANIEKFILESKLYAKVENIFLALERRFTTIGKILGKVFRPVINAIRNMPVSRLIGQITEIASSIFRVILRPLKMVMTVLGKTGGINNLGKWFALGKSFGTILGRLAAPIIVIMSIIDTVKGAVEGFKTGGIMGAIKGGISGLLSGLVGSMLDLVKDGISWVAGKLGFENFSKMLDGFSFSKLITDGVDAIFGVIDYAIDWFKSIFSPEKFKSAFDKFGIAGITSTIVGGVFDTAKGAVSWLATMLGAFDIANALDNFSFGETINKGLESIWKVFSNMWDGIISTVDAITDWWKDWSFDGVFTSIKDFFFGIWDDVIGWLDGVGGNLLGMFGNASDFILDFYRSILREILPDRSKPRDLIDPIGMVARFIPDAVYDFAKVQKTVTPAVLQQSPVISPIASNRGTVLMQNPQPTSNTIVNNIHNNVTEGSTTNVTSTRIGGDGASRINPFSFGSGAAATY